MLVKSGVCDKRITLNCKIPILKDPDDNINKYNKLPFYQTTNFRLFQTEGVWRRQFYENSREFSQRVEKNCGKTRNCS